MKASVARKYEAAKVKYGPEVERMKRKAEEKHMTLKGYSVDKIEDNSLTGFITEFEFYLPLKKIDIDEYERRLKKLIKQAPPAKIVITEQ